MSRVVAYGLFVAGSIAFLVCSTCALPRSCRGSSEPRCGLGFSCGGPLGTPRCAARFGLRRPCPVSVGGQTLGVCSLRGMRPFAAFSTKVLLCVCTIKLDKVNPRISKSSCSCGRATAGICYRYAKLMLSCWCFCFGHIRNNKNQSFTM